ncbi:MAG: peptidoglycan DD-metalloendopeptidase family protein [Candidatus Neomarinimicrobiota bacterium]|nr:peptidoglycan DD-metalloendopeptidase family protein [Candidatus Neomarinimicrobiota bacterium]
MKSLFRLLFILFISILMGQTKEMDKNIRFHSGELDKIRREIAEFEKRISEASNREKSEIERLNEIDEEISLVRDLLFRLRTEEKLKQRSIDEAEKLIARKETDQDSLVTRYTKRVITSYKKGRLSDLGKLLDSESWSQSVYRAKYLKIISDYDRKLADEIRATVSEIERQQSIMRSEVADILTIDKEKSSRKKWLEQRRRVRSKQLDNLKRDRQQMTVALKEKHKAAREMETIITRLERERVTRIAELERRRKEAELIAAAPFRELKGKLPWPIEGAVISRFGTYRNPELKTVTENTGIDIRGKSGSEVRAIYDGIVTTVTYIRGYGNTVILDHGDGFYSVYTHVIDVEVDENSYVNARDVIAYVGDSGSLEGAKLHLEIWENRAKLNPESWLRESR